MRCVHFGVAAASLFAAACRTPPLDELAPQEDGAIGPDLARVIDLAPYADLLPARDRTELPDLTTIDLLSPNGYPAAHPPLPKIVDVGGARLTSPRITSVTFAGDQHAAPLDAFVASMVTVPYWLATTDEYGIGQARVEPPIHLKESPSSRITDDDIQTWLVDRLDGTHPEWGAPDANSLYVLFYPQKTTIDLFGAQSCVDFAGYHFNVQLPSGLHLAYAVVPRCPTGGNPIDEITGSASHEILEAVTDPDPLTNTAYGRADSKHSDWESFAGAEVCDFCEFASDAFFKPFGLSSVVQRAWSNRAALFDHDPCVPNDGSPYFNSAPVLVDQINVKSTIPGMAIAPGKSKTIELDLFSDFPTSDWTVTANEFPLSGDLTFSFDRSSGNNGDKLHLTVTVVQTGPWGYDQFLIISEQGAKQRVWPVTVAPN